MQPGLEFKLRVIVRRAIRENAPQSIPGRDPAALVTHIRRVNIEAGPLNPSKWDEGLLLVAFQEQLKPAGEVPAETSTRADPAQLTLWCTSLNWSWKPRRE